MIDTHCHLTDPRLASQLDGVLAHAASAGVHTLITIGTDLDDSAACVELCGKHKNIRCAVGVHPTSVMDHAYSSQRLVELIRDPTAVAVGEIGLDYYWHKEPPQHEIQKRIFTEQLQLAADHAKPVVLHCREAVADCLAIMKDFPRVSAVFHCFTGTPQEAKAILDAGYWLGFTGAVTFKKNDGLREAAKLTSLNRLLVETDCPYLTPEPMRKQKVNEPAMVVHIARLIAELHGFIYADFEKMVDENARRFFGF